MIYEVKASVNEIFTLDSVDLAGVWREELEV